MQYKFDNKIEPIITSKELIVTAIKKFQGNPHDSRIIESLLEQMRVNLGHTPKKN